MEKTDQLFLEKLNSIIEENFDNADFSIDYLCREIGTSRSHLHRKIKSVTGKSISLYIRKIRLDRAVELLSSTERNISEIAYLTGINSPQNLSKYFTDEYGQSPTTYRKSIVDKKQLESPTNEEDQETLVVKIKSKIIAYKWWVSLATILLGVLCIYIYKSSFHNTEIKELTDETFISSTIPENSIVVLPFIHIGPVSTSYFTTGVTEDILTNLALIRDIKVISRTSSMRYKNTKKNLRQIAEELKVAYVLEGSVRREGTQVRITAQLIRAKDDFHVWAKNYDRKTEDIFAIQSEVSKEIAASLNQNISQELSGILGHAPTENVRAYNNLLEGRHLIKTRKKKELEESIRKFDEAIRLDSHFSEAYSHKAEAYNIMGNMGYMDIKESSRLAEVEALKAIQLNAENGFAYAILANIYRDMNKWKVSATSYEIALKYSPNNALINYWYSLFLRETGYLDKAYLYSKKATTLDPLYPVIFAGHIVNCVYVKKNAEARGLISKGEHLFGDNFLIFWSQAHYYIFSREYNKALDPIDKALRINPNVKALVAMKLFCLGKLGESTIVEKEVRSNFSNGTEDLIYRSLAYLGLGEKEKSLDLLAEAARLGIIQHDIKVDPKYESLQNEPRYKKILEDFGLVTAPNKL